MATQPSPPTPAPQKGRGSLFLEGLQNLARSFWFIISLLIYSVGMLFFYVGKGLIELSGWGPRPVPRPSRYSPPKAGTSSGSSAGGKP